MNPFPSILNVKQEEIVTAEKRGAYTVTILGAGREGLALGTAFAEAGFRTILTDSDQSLIKRLARGKPSFSEREVESKLRSLWRTERLTATSDLKSAISQSDIVIVTINPKIDEKKNIDFSEVEKSLKQVGTNMKRGTLIVYTGIAGVGFMENAAKEALVNASGLKLSDDFGLAYSQMEVSKTHPPLDFAINLELSVAANDKISLDSAAAVLATISKRNVRQIGNFKTAELAMLFSAVRRDVNLALTNELALLCENAGMDYFEILKLLDTQLPLSTLAPTISGDNEKEAYTLLGNAEDLNTKLRFAALGRQLNEDIIRHAVNLTQNALRSCGRTLRRSKITLIGTAEPGTPGETYARMLGAKGAKTSIFDPLKTASENSVRADKTKRNIADAAEGSDCIVFLQEQELLKTLNLKNLKTVMRSPSAIIDLAGAIEPEKAETEGFIYRGLGKGAGKK